MTPQRVNHILSISRARRLGTALGLLLMLAMTHTWQRTRPPHVREFTPEQLHSITVVADLWRRGVVPRIDFGVGCAYVRRADWDFFSPVGRAEMARQIAIYRTVRMGPLPLECTMCDHGTGEELATWSDADGLIPAAIDTERPQISTP